MMSKSNMKKIFTILVGFLFISSCSQSTPTESQIVTSAPTSQPSTPSPTSLPTAISPTPTDEVFVLPGGRLLFEAAVNSDASNADPSTPGFNQYFWLQLPNMKVEAHQYLIGEYPIREKAVTLSPDFSHLGFAQEVYTQSGDNLYGSVSVSVYLSNPDSNEAIQIGDAFTGDAIADERWKGPAFSWSANSEVLAFARSTDWTSFEQQHLLYIYEVISGNLKTIRIDAVQPYAFALSPDGAQLAFTALSATPGLSLINADGTDQRMMVEGWVSQNLVWHPDGKRLFFVCDKPELGIYGLDVSTGAITFVTATGDHVGLLSLSPDGSLISYEDFGIHVVDANGGEPLRLTGGGNGFYDWTWSPDSQYIATTYSVDGSILIMDRLGNGKVRVYDEDQLRPIRLIGWLP
ncbi:MAG: hypothetical protein H7Y59_08015 [Anaerolineales bacterium]|nr:hypothetical protein [Anaerolineales bacterium]